MPFGIVDLAKTDIGHCLRKNTLLRDEALCGTILADNAVLIVSVEEKKIHYITNKKGVLRRGSL